MKPLSEEARFILSLPTAQREELVDLVEHYIALISQGWSQELIKDELSGRIETLEKEVDEPAMIRHIVLGAALDSQDESSVTINQ